MDHEGSDSSWTTIDFADADEPHLAPTPPLSPLASEPHASPVEESKESASAAVSKPCADARWVPIDQLAEAAEGSQDACASSPAKKKELPPTTAPKITQTNALPPTTTAPKPTPTSATGNTLLTTTSPTTRAELPLPTREQHTKRVDHKARSSCRRWASRAHDESCECPSCQRAHQSCFTAHGCVML